MQTISIVNEWGILCLVPAVGNPDFFMVFIVVFNDETDYPPFYIPKEVLASYMGGIRAQT